MVDGSPHSTKITYSIEFINDQDKWTHWYYCMNEEHAREAVSDFIPGKGAPHPIRAVKVITTKEVLCVAGTARDVACPPQPGVDYSKHSS